MTERHSGFGAKGSAAVTAEDWDRRYRDRDFAARIEPNRFLVVEVAGLTPGRALDLACGVGRNAVWLAEQGWQVTAVDFSEVALARARELAANQGVEVEWIAADLLQYRPQPGDSELVLILYLQLPADERRLVLERAAGAVAPGGTLLVVGHDLENLRSGHGGPSNPAVLFRADDIVAELPGLEVERAERVLRTVEADGEEHTAIDALVRARRRTSV